MGAWGAGSFDNDAALDFAGEIEGIADLESVCETEGLEEVDADLACQMIVAAECVAAMRGHRSPDMPDDLAERVHGLGKPTLALFDSARTAVSVVMGGSELVELWAEADKEERAAFNRSMTDLIERLNRPQGRRSKPKKKTVNPNPSPCMICDKPMGDGEFHQFSITLLADDISEMKQGGWVHMSCINAALHPKHMIQNWQYDDELLKFALAKIRSNDEN